MPTLTEMLKEYDRSLQLIIADQWGIDQDLDQKADTAKQIAEQFAANHLAKELLDSLSQNERKLIQHLVHDGGRIQRDQIERAFGSIREMGAARRHKERPDQNPLSVAEALYYKGLIGIAFLSGQAGIEEFIYIPDDVLLALQNLEPADSHIQLPGIPEDQIAVKLFTSDAILDHACILLAALRSGRAVDSIKFSHPRLHAYFLLQLLKEINLVKEDLSVQPDQVRIFLEEERCSSFSKLISAWQTSFTINELRMLEDLEFEGKWQNDPQSTRKNLIRIISQLPSNTWFKTESFIEWVHQFHPDFQRTAGDYDAWFIRERATGDYLKGYENWTKIEGRLLQFMLTGPLFWLGFIDLGLISRKPALSAFRLSDWSSSLFQNEFPNYVPKEHQSLKINEQLEFHLERPFVREYHYQIARFSKLSRIQKNRYVYQVTPQSLQFAENQGINIKQIMALTSKLAGKSTPPNFTKVLINWQNSHTRVNIQKSLLIRVSSPVILDQLISGGMGEYVTERISPTCAKVRQDSVEKIKMVLLRMGYLADIDPEV